MAEEICALAGDTKLETPEGALTVKSMAAKPVSIFTWEKGRARFRMARDIRLVAEQQPVLRITLADGASFRVGPAQVLYKKGMVEARAGELQSGDELVPTFHYPEGYQFRDDRQDGATATSIAAIRVAAVEPGGEADIYSLAINVSGCFFLSAGVLAKSL
ncbi:MAG TPA: hypothetical protein VEB21_21395 [Terriglobales bacterium]|nr:hypothetical protein [Terriglobales bacterium]